MFYTYHDSNLSKEYVRKVGKNMVYNLLLWAYAVRGNIHDSVTIL